MCYICWAGGFGVLGVKGEGWRPIKGDGVVFALFK